MSTGNMWCSTEQYIQCRNREIGSKSKVKVLSSKYVIILQHIHIIIYRYHARKKVLPIICVRRYKNGKACKQIPLLRSMCEPYSRRPNALQISDNFISTFRGHPFTFSDDRLLQDAWHFYGNVLTDQKSRQFSFDIF